MLDVANPAQPVEVGFHPSFPNSVAADGNLAYAGTGSEGFQILRFTAWTRSYELFYADPKKGGLPDFDRCRKILDKCAGKLDDLIILSTFNLQIPKPADGTPTGVAVWDSDFIYADKDAPDVAKKLIDECHSRNIAVHAGYAIVDAGTQSGNRSNAFCKFMEVATDDQINEMLIANPRRIFSVTGAY